MFFVTNNPQPPTNQAYFYSVKQLAESQAVILAASTKNIPGRLRVADLDMDGFPDLSLTVQFGNMTTQSYILNNVDTNCAHGPLRQLQTQVLFQQVSEFAESSSLFITYFDIDEDGRLDFIIQQIEYGIPSLKVIYNNIVSDTFFLKIYMVNSKLQKVDTYYGDNMVGASCRFVVTDLNDKKYIIVGSQSFQSSYLSL